MNNLLTYIHLSYDPAAHPEKILGLSHNDDVSEVVKHFTFDTRNTRIVLPVAKAICNLAKKEVLISADNDRISVFPNESSAAAAVEGNRILLPTSCSIYALVDRSQEACYAASAYAVINSKVCAEAFAMFADEPTTRTLIYAHKVVMDFITDKGITIDYVNLSELKNGLTNPTALTEFIHNIDYNAVKTRIFADKPKVQNRALRFRKGTFSEKNLFPIGPEYVLDEQYKPVCSSVVNGALSVLLYGPSGTGKSVTAKQMCRDMNIPVLAVVNCTANSDEFLLGKYVITDDGPRFVESNVTRAIRNGGAVIFEEINFAKPQYLSFLNSLLDDNGFVMLDNGEYVNRSKNFRFFATMNDGYAGTKRMNEALLNRMEFTIEVPELSENIIRGRLLSEFPTCELYLDRIMEIYKRVRALTQSGEADGVISVRNLCSWVRLAQFEDYRSAAEKTIIGSAVNSPETRKAYRDIIDLYVW